MKIVRYQSRAVQRKTRGRKGEGSLKLRGKTWWYIIPDPLSPGKRIEKSCETSDREEALVIKHKAQLKARSPRANAVSTIDDLLDDYQKYINKERPRSVRSLTTSIKHLRKGMGKILADKLKSTDADIYREQRISEDAVSDATVNRELGYLRAALRREMRYDNPRVTKIPFMNTPSEKDNVREGFIDRSDYEKILPALPAPLQAIFVCAFHTGARSGELKTIEWQHVNFAQSIIELRPKTTKNSDGRWIPIWGDMREYLLRQKELRDRTMPDCPWVFFWPAGYHPRAVPGSRLASFRWAWQEAITKAGYPDLLFHDLRRSAIRFADQEAGISSRLVRLMSGHKTDAVYTRYNIGGGRDISRMAEALDKHLHTGKVVEMRKVS